MNKKHFTIQNDNDKFIIGYFGADLYWIMLDYHEDNKFVIAKEQTQFYNILKRLFNFMENEQVPQLKGNVFNWISEARQEDESNHMTITKCKNAFVIHFVQNPNDFFSVAAKTCAICFCLNGSRNQYVSSMFSIATHKLLGTL